MSHQNKKTEPMKKMGPPIHEKPQNFKRALLNLASFSKRYLPIVIIALFLAGIASVFSVLGPKQLEKLVNEIAKGIWLPIDFDTVHKITFILIGIYLTSIICMAVQSLLMTNVSQNVSKHLRNEINKKMNSIPLKYVDSVQHGELLSRVTNDSDTIAQGLNNSFSTLVHSVVLLLATLVMMFVSNWILALSTIASSLIGLFLSSFVMKHSQKHFVAQQTNLGKINGHIEETYSGHNIIKLYNATDEEFEKFSKLNSTLYTSAWKSQFFGGIMMPIMGFIGNLGYVVVCVVGSVLVLNGVVGIGTITAFIIYARMFTNPLSQIAQSLNFMQSTAAASERVFDFLGEEDLPNENHITKKLSPQKVKGDVSFENVTFGYNPDKTIINDFSINIHSGQKVAIVGPTGTGKTTIVNLLMKFYEPSTGTITIDGHPMQNLTRENIHNLFGMVLQDTWLFDGTIKENLVFNNNSFTDEQIQEVIKECELEHFINTLPNGIDTILDDNTSISAGQKQLLTIARAILQNSPMIILDEATSSVDTRTELLIQKALDRLSKDRTSFVIAHRLSTIKNADIIIVMQNGDIVETGNHRTLLAKNGAYAKLYNSQFTANN